MSTGYRSEPNITQEPVNINILLSQVKYRLLHGRLDRIGEASADTAATETYYKNEKLKRSCLQSDWTKK